MLRCAALLPVDALQVPGRSLLDVGVEAALADSGFDESAFIRRVVQRNARRCAPDTGDNAGQLPRLPGATFAGPLIMCTGAEASTRWLPEVPTVAVPEC